MNKNIYKSYHYKLLISYKEEIRQKIIDYIFNNPDNDPCVLRNEDILFLLLNSEDDLDKDLMSYEELMDILMYVCIDCYSFPNIYTALKNVSDDELSDAMILEDNDIERIFNILSNKRVDDDINYELINVLCKKFIDYKDFDYRVLLKLCSDDIEYNYYEYDKYLKLEKQKKDADMALAKLLLKKFKKADKVNYNYIQSPKSEEENNDYILVTKLKKENDNYIKDDTSQEGPKYLHF